MGLVVQEKTEGGAPDGLHEMKGGEAGVTDVWEKSSVGHNLEQDKGRGFSAPGKSRKQTIRQRNS